VTAPRYTLETVAKALVETLRETGYHIPQWKEAPEMKGLWVKRAALLLLKLKEDGVIDP
jgi:hypothetical protein